MKWAELGLRRGVYHLFNTWKSSTSEELRYEAACGGKGSDSRAMGENGDRYCEACLKVFRDALD